MTFVLVSVVYAVAIGEPNFGVMGPFAVGLALFAMVFAGKVGFVFTACTTLVHLTHALAFAGAYLTLDLDGGNQAHALHQCSSAPLKTSVNAL